MTDSTAGLVERLRRYARNAGRMGESTALMYEAADAIERLQGELEPWRGPDTTNEPDWNKTPPEVIEAARLLLRWAGPTKAWSIMGIGVSDHGEVQQRLSHQLIMNVNLQTDNASLRQRLEAAEKDAELWRQHVASKS